jgi:hypothetical protein
MQVILVFIEAHIGLPLRDCPSSFRAAGTMVTPNSLGVLTVVSLAFYYVYSSAKTYFSIFLLVGGTILLASGSGTGIIALFVLVGALCLTNTSGLRKMIVAGALLTVSAGLLAKLPALLNRSDIYASVFSSDGRIGKFTEVFSESSPIEILVGRGIGFGTNTATNLHIGAPSSADSMVTVLLMQLGMVGVILFYTLLIWAYRRDARARPVYLVFAITSLTINITEVFPVNFLLGLALAGTLSLSRPARAITRHDRSAGSVPGHVAPFHVHADGRDRRRSCWDARPPKNLTDSAHIQRVRILPQHKFFQRANEFIAARLTVRSVACV